MDGIPETGTKDDLLSDATDLGVTLSERLLVDWTAKGLLGSPTRRPLGRGQGQALGTYSPQQRALFRAVVRNRASGAKNDRLAHLPVYAWLYWGDDWATLTQARKALRLALGLSPGKSSTKPRRLSHERAWRAAQSFVLSTDVAQVTPAKRAALRRAVCDLLEHGESERRLEGLDSALQGLLDTPRLEVLRGPADAPLCRQSVMAVLRARIAGARGLDMYPDQAFERVRAHHQREWHAYQASEVERLRDLDAALHPIYSNGSASEHVDGAPALLLQMLGMGLGDQP